MRTLLLAAALLAPGTALAQSPDVTAEELARSVESGERVILTAHIPCQEAEGLETNPRSASDSGTCTVKGRLTLLPQGVLMRGDVDRTFPFGAIDRVQRPKDRIWNGALIGYAIGFAPFALMEIDCRRTEGCWEGLPLAVGMVISGPIGFGIGALSDALIGRPRIAYERAVPHREASLAPLVTRGGAGVRISLVF